ncbi:hypothetical protein [Paenibacillus radicis (ex Xue et al. 2023)]|uniref:Uncharacterized protein n=1 Tax=Paenibacillus radicis (ex Xue et al. 2023) TaxID=2972489 RepID=A0ABT1YNX9_9BACL|nr:hypothetical protein [Paenibacillus radicis (ex Xue et al. 2023)]MCR8634881.1 hypothetical protein [Paenibacillus radicis (ex Xue et al. 2023)]
MSNDYQKPVYYDGSGVLSWPVRLFEIKDLVIKPANIAIEPLLFPVFPHPIQS